MDVLKKAFYFLLVILSLGAGVTIYKYWRMLDDKGDVSQLYAKMMPNLTKLPEDESIKDIGVARGGDIIAIVDTYKAAEAAISEAQRTGKPLVPVATPKPVATPAPDQRLITEWGTGRKMVALTFDDGPNPEFTPRMIGLLREKQAKATFFVLGQQVARGEAILKSAVAEGHEIGSHSWSHKQLSTLKGQALTDEVMKGIDAIESVTGIRPRLVRPPYGAQNKTVRDFAQTNNFYLINWSVDTNDWRSSTKVSDIVKEADTKAYDGCIILMHDRLERTVEATGQIIDTLRAKGYRFVTVSQLLGLDDPDNPQQPHPIQPETQTTSTTTAPEMSPVSPSLAETATPADIIPNVTPTPVVAASPTPKAVQILPAPQLPGVNYNESQPAESASPININDLPDNVITRPKR